MRNIIGALVMLTALGCSNTTMTGTNGKKSAESREAKTKPADLKPGKEQTSPVVPPYDDTSSDAATDSSNLEATNDTAVTDPGSDVIADEIVDGMEVINDCGRCDLRAKQLSVSAGFQAEMSRTYNMGFYKVDPSRGICDIHFMADMSDEIADHDGQDSVLDQQIAMYCPCNCGWASKGPEDSFPDDFED